MGSFILKTDEEEDLKLGLYAAQNGLSGKIEAIRKLIGELPTPKRTR